MSYENFKSLRVTVDAGVATLTIDHPPINLFDVVLIGEMDRVGRELEGDDAVRVVVVESADPEFFIAHADVHLILGLPPAATPASEPSVFQRMVGRFRSMPKATLAKIAGICRGGGSELALAMDMRFAARDRAILGQPEVAVGILPGGGGCQRLPRLVGRGRALEIVLGAGDFDAELAERYGYVNRAIPDAELDEFVDALARRIASFPAPAIARTKAAVAAAEQPLEAGLTEEARLFEQCLATPEARQRMQAFLDAGGQTREIESVRGARFG